MTIVFLAAFITGLLLAVRVMLYGVERGREAAAVLPVSPDPLAAPAAPVRVRAWEPSLAAFFTTLGFAGYIGTRGSDDPVIPVLVAFTLAMLAWYLAARLVATAVAFTPEHDPDDPRYVLQGLVARVTAPIGPDADGEILFEASGAPRRVPARGLEGCAAPVGAEVVIERISEEGVAYVESWAEVEKRL